jgi:hypothetical protein
MLDKLLPIWKAAQPDLLTGGNMDPYMQQMWNQGIRMMPGGGAATGALPLPAADARPGVVSGAPTQPPTPGQGGVPAPAAPTSTGNPYLDSERAGWQ